MFATPILIDAIKYRRVWLAYENEFLHGEYKTLSALLIDLEYRFSEFKIVIRSVEKSTKWWRY